MDEEVVDAADADMLVPTKDGKPSAPDASLKPSGNGTGSISTLSPRACWWFSRAGMIRTRFPPTDTRHGSRLGMGAVHGALDPLTTLRRCLQ